MGRPRQPLRRAVRLDLALPEAVFVGIRWIDDAGDVPGFGQNEAPFAPEQRHALPGSLPEGDVIVHGGHQQHRGLHLGESDAGVADLELPFTSWFSR